MPAGAIKEISQLKLEIILNKLLRIKSVLTAFLEAQEQTVKADLSADVSEIIKEFCEPIGLKCQKILELPSEEKTPEVPREEASSSKDKGVLKKEVSTGGEVLGEEVSADEEELDKNDEILYKKTRLYDETLLLLNELYSSLRILSSTISTKKYHKNEEIQLLPELLKQVFCDDDGVTSTSASSRCVDDLPLLIPAPPEKYQEFFIRYGKQILSKLYNSDTTIKYPYTELYKDRHYARTLSAVINSLRKKSSEEDGELLGKLKWAFSSAPLKAAKRRSNSEKTEQYVSDRREYLTSVVSVIWALYSIAKEEKGIDLERGSFTIPDPDGKLYDFFIGYVAFANGKMEPSQLDKLFFVNSNNFAYPRISSHHKAYSKRQFGIDTRYYGGEYSVPILPHQHTHFLFSCLEIDGQRCFFGKPEKDGLGNFTEILRHTMDYGKSGVKRSMQSEDGFRREKDVPEDLLESYIKFFKAIAPEGLSIDENVVKKLKVHQMWKAIVEIKVLPNKEALAAQREFVQRAVAHKMTLDLLNKQVGNEIVLDLPSIFKSKKGDSSMMVSEEASSSSSSASGSSSSSGSSSGSSDSLSVVSAEGEQQLYTLTVNTDDTQCIYFDEGIVLPPSIFRDEVFTKDLNDVDCAKSIKQMVLEKKVKDKEELQFYKDATRLKGGNICIHTANHGILVAHSQDDGDQLIKILSDNYLHAETKSIFESFIIQTCHQGGILYLAEACFIATFASAKFIGVKINTKPLYIDLSNADKDHPIVKMVEEFDIIGYPDPESLSLEKELLCDPQGKPIATVQFASEIDLSKSTHKFTPKQLVIKIINPELAKGLFSKFIKDKKISVKLEDNVPTKLMSTELELKIIEALSTDRSLFKEEAKEYQSMASEFKEAIKEAIELQSFREQGFDVTKGHVKKKHLSSTVDAERHVAKFIPVEYQTSVSVQQDIVVTEDVVRHTSVKKDPVLHSVVTLQSLKTKEKAPQDDLLLQESMQQQLKVESEKSEESEAQAAVLQRRAWRMSASAVQSSSKDSSDELRENREEPTRTKETEIKTKAAEVIQRAWRVLAANRKVSELRANRNIEIELAISKEAATTIKRVYKGMLARLKVESLKKIEAMTKILQQRLKIEKRRKLMYIVAGVIGVVGIAASIAACAVGLIIPGIIIGGVTAMLTGTLTLGAYNLKKPTIAPAVVDLPQPPAAAIPLPGSAAQERLAPEAVVAPPMLFRSGMGAAVTLARAACRDLPPPVASSSSRASLRTN